MTTTFSPIQRALLSVSDKTGIVDFAKALQVLGIEILSTGGTAKLLQEHRIPVIEVSSYTGFPEIMDGRVKTLHPKIHGGLLGRRGIDDAIMQKQEIAPIDLLVVNLYPFIQTVSNPNCDLATAIENIDIGGPTMLRAAAKNYTAVTVLVDPADYTETLKEIQQHGNTSATTRFKLAKKVFTHTANYDGMISNYLSSLDKDNKPSLFSDTFSMQWQKKQALNYGENPHQKGALYVESPAIPGTVANAQQLQGKPLSYNNIADADAAFNCVKEFEFGPACVIVKHANPCGVAVAATQLEAYQRAFKTDPTSAFGGIIAFNTELTAETAQVIIQQQFVEVIVAPKVTSEALEIIKQKPNVRVLATEESSNNSNPTFDYKRINGGLLIQETDLLSYDPQQLHIVTEQKPSNDQLNDLLFAWKVAKHVKSNAIVYTKNNATIGIGAGQMSRIDSARIAVIKAQEQNLELKDAVMASDAFFPFRDSVDAAAKAGISAIIQPGGSIRDKEVIAAADEAQLVMVFTGIRHFRH